MRDETRQSDGRILVVIDYEYVVSDLRKFDIRMPLHTMEKK